jgi:hypothetical protein
MIRKTWIKLKRGILDPKHRERIGIRIWLYLHMLDRANWVQRRQLEIDGYIRCERRGHFQRVTILKWVNPREYTGMVYNPPQVAGTDEEASLQNQGLEESASGRSSCNPSCNPSGQLSPLAQDLKISHITDHMSQRTAAAPAAASQTLWVQVLGHLQRQFRKSDFETWIRDTQVVSQTDSEIIVGTANNYALSWLQDHATKPAEAAVEKMAGRPMSVRFVVLERAPA